MIAFQWEKETRLNYLVRYNTKGNIICYIDLKRFKDRNGYWAHSATILKTDLHSFQRCSFNGIDSARSWIDSKLISLGYSFSSKQFNHKLIIMT